MSYYFDSAQQRDIQALSLTFTGRTQWPTWFLLLAVPAAWFALLLGSPLLGAGWTIVLLIPVVVLWMSVQHELLHGHPTRFNGLNKVLGYAPFALWYPYTLYRDSHLQHHRDHDLTLPGIDPESRYMTQAHWQGSSKLLRGLLWLNKTVPGRLLVGPPLALYGMAQEELRRLRRGDRQAWCMWLTHGFFTLLMFAFIAYCSELAVWQYVFLVTVPVLSVGMVRSFYEHRPAVRPEQRTVLNEAGWPWTWLFLNLNLHLVHHDLPSLPWFYLPRVYRARRAQWQQRSGGFLVQGYGELIRRHAVQAIDSPQHPFS
ncbi:MULTISPECIES: fatty acid desaturase [Pseudomonas]|jgi:fatty acid desaturase|uniref:Fatty acid desaturase n=1 Tax=Pseudomonas sp. WC2401 TaxID=3234143 RepID=A0AB39X3D1_9PSED|nr:fatty acid desaturase [Pseudomonas fragi]NNA99893.1 fatty acid desaturase [Pseudomonas fragi]NNB08701.1 fatty acid desaturase [Pseudomonas fragi]